MSTAILRYEKLNRRQKEDVVKLYNEKWTSGTLLEKAQRKTQTSNEQALKERELIRRLKKDHTYFDERSSYFPEGQLVALEGDEVKAALTTIPSLLDINALLNNEKNAYDRLHEYEVIYKFRNSLKGERTIYCISIVGEDLYASLLLNEIKDIGSSLDFSVMPFSAPRSLRFYYEKRPEKWEVEKYLLTTKRMNDKERSIWQQKKIEIIRNIYNRFIEKPEIIKSTEDFFKWFFDSYGREPTLRDIMIYFDERPLDFTLNFHMMKGADLIYFNNKPVILQDSRPEDAMAYGYNMLLIYD